MKVINSISEIKEMLASNLAIEVACEVDSDNEDGTLYLAYATNTITNSGSVGMYCIADNEYNALECARDMLYDHDVKTGAMKDYYEKTAEDFDMSSDNFWNDGLHLSTFTVSKECVIYLMEAKNESNI